MRVGCRWENQKERKKERKKALGRPRRRCVDDIKMDLRLDAVVWAGSIWLRMETSGGLLCRG
jgi:hypothetical protein